MGLLPQLELLAVFSHKLGHDNMSEQCNNICPYSKYKHTVSLRHRHTYQTDYAYILLSLNPSSFRAVPKIWLVMAEMDTDSNIHDNHCLQLDVYNPKGYVPNTRHSCINME